MATKVLNEVSGKFGTFSEDAHNPSLLDMESVAELLTETNNTLKGTGFDIEAPDAMRTLYTNDSLARTYIDGLSEGLEGEDAKNFRILSNNMMDCITGKGQFSNKGILNLLEDNTSAGFMPVSKLIFPMFRFSWPRLHVREITTVVPMDSPEITRYFFKAFAKSLDNKIIPLPSYNPLGNGQVIGSMTSPKEVAVPATVNLLDDIGASSSNTHIAKNAMIVGYEGIDPAGETFSDADSRTPIMLTIDPDGKYELHVDCDPKATQATAVVDVVSGIIDFDRGIVAASSTRSTESNGKVTKIKLVCSATSSEHNISPKIVFDGKQIKLQARDIQLSSEWSDQYVYDMSKRTGMDIISELTCIIGNQIQLTINKSILDDILFHVGRHGDNIRLFEGDPAQGRTAFAYTKRQWADELLFHIEKCSARIYTATNNLGATHIVANPEDVVWLQMLNSFSFSGDSFKQGTYGRANVGTVSNGMSVISTPLCPQGYMLLASKPSDVTLANYILAPYVPISVSPFPLGQRPAMTFTVRFGQQMIRSEGFGLIKIRNNQ